VTDARAFYLPGAYDPADGRMHGAVYVELWGGEAARPWPVVMIHGGGQTGTCFTIKPDGGEGWAQAFAHAGFAAYVIDEPARGRSPYDAEADGPLQPVFPAETAERVFTATARHRLWPGAEKHDQWPGSGVAGDPVFDRFYASQVPMRRDHAAMEEAATQAIVALLHEIGPAILIAHSQGCPRGWRVADAVPELVKGLIAVEPMGRPFYWTVELAKAFGIPPDTLCHPFGLCIGPLTYDPSTDDMEERLRWRAPENLGRRRLPNLARVPIAIVSADASYHRNSDLEIAEFLTAMGVANRLLLLEKLGITGNGHMMMLERNSDAIAAVIMAQIEAWELG
jgi:pimeloyl-ACP methyl ester carboxylesterase